MKLEWNDMRYNIFTAYAMGKVIILTSYWIDGSYRIRINNLDLTLNKKSLTFDSHEKAQLYAEEWLEVQVRKLATTLEITLDKPVDL